MQENSARPRQLHGALFTVRGWPKRPDDEAEGPQRIQIQDLAPLVDCGRYAVKACVGDEIRVEATIFRDGHQVLGAAAARSATAGGVLVVVPLRDVPLPAPPSGWRNVLDAGLGVGLYERD